MTDEPSTAVLAAILTRVEQTLVAQRAEMNSRLDQMPTLALLEEQFKGLRVEISGLSTRLTRAETAVEALDHRMDTDAADRTEELKRAQKQRDRDRRAIWLAVFTAIVAPVIVGVVVALILGGGVR